MNASIVIPAHNEQENLPKLLDKLMNLKSALKDSEIVVVDDNSNDKTGFIADSYSKKHRNIRVLHRKKGINGMGAALKDGTKIARGRYVVWVMGDNSDDLSAIPRFIGRLKNGYDIVFGSRYMKGGSRGDLDMFKAMLSSGYTFIANLLFSLKVHDITNAFRGFKKNIMGKIILEEPGFSISPEFAIKAYLAGFKLGEVPTVYTNRVKGVSNFKLYKMTRSYLELYLRLYFRLIIQPLFFKR